MVRQYRSAYFGKLCVVIIPQYGEKRNMKRFQMEYIENDSMTVIELSARSQAEAVQKIAQFHNGKEVCIRIKQI